MKVYVGIIFSQNDGDIQGFALGRNFDEMIKKLADNHVDKFNGTWTIDKELADNRKEPNRQLIASLEEPAKYRKNGDDFVTVGSFDSEPDDPNAPDEDYTGMWITVGYRIEELSEKEGE